jgi:adenosylcobalamin-dependent ribonucleoside-triphosphate reductase
MIEFITKKNIQEAEEKYGIPPYGALGSVVDSRTYLRWLPKEKRRETFYERNARKTNYNISLAEGYQSQEELEKEAQNFFDRLNKLLVWGSGRVAWVGGTKATDLVPEATMNCSASIVDRPKVFVEALHLLCLGCGYGFRVYPEDLAKFPKIKSYPIVSFEEYKPLPKEQRLEDTVKTGNKITVGDSREGWCDALSLLLDAFFSEGDQSLVFNLDSVRPEGERILGFGGLASGPQPLIGMLKEISRILIEETENDSLRPINALDILCCIGDLVRSGNVRRSSLICLFHPKDNEIKNAKRGIWTDPKLAKKRYRSMSNNSISYDGIKPSLEELQELMQVIRYEGEPGFVRADLHKQRRHEAALKYRPNEDPKNYTEQAGITNP